MNTIAKFSIVLLFYLLKFTSSQAQLVNFTSTSLNDYSQTDANKNTEAIVVGDFFGFGAIPQAALNVNTNYLGGLTNIPPSYGSFGEVFRTDAPDFDATGAIFSFWRMWTGPPDNALEHLAIFNSDSWSIIPSPFNDINFRATSGNMFLWTESGPPNRATKRMMINNDNPTNLAVQGVTNANAVDPNWNTNGYVGIGNNNSNQWDPDLGGAGPHTLLHLEGPNNTGFIGRAVV
ncbi:MAG: hypothetical protein IPP71_15195 [Bacteroidetes bacterium]|nr:hypothetical protein [Bacteroidota bacterium]